MAFNIISKNSSRSGANTHCPCNTYILRTIMQHRLNQTVIIFLLLVAAGLSSCDPSAVDSTKIIKNIEPKEYQWLHPMLNQMHCAMPGTPYSMDGIVFDPINQGIMLDTTDGVGTLVMNIDSLPIGMYAGSSGRTSTTLHSIHLLSDTITIHYDSLVTFSYGLSTQAGKITDNHCSIRLRMLDSTNNSTSYQDIPADGENAIVVGHIRRTKAEPNKLFITLHYYLHPEAQLADPQLVVTLSPQFY